ncbi:polysaccharide deacetylase family protein [Planomonospora sp. ID82291]|uniref:polysaccharide deacetylase family protein n=1 Tax=Planomonospora sp. ID82291 TaxID=2738136 RepID=UPI0018C437E8|nr:polysaccharide deacetylase family protein [Planomonospora sp. ID82291]MBG0813879.1 polysaccharide deacetylase family protein [Planomonospora sp. ID82291]
MHRMRFVGGVALLTVAMIGCGATTPSHAADQLIPSEPTLVEYADPAKVRGLTTATVTDGDSGERTVHIAYPVLADAPRLTERLRAVVTERLDRFTATATRPPGPDGRARPELNVDWRLPAAGEQVVGVRLGVGELTQSGWRESRTTVWYDRVEGRAVDSPGLLSGGPALASLAGLVRAELAGRGPGVDAAAVRADARLFDSLAFNRHGGLVVEFDDYQVAAGSLGRVAVAVPAGRTAGLLSPTGLRAQAAAVRAGRPPGSPPTAESIRETIEAAAAGRPAARSTRAGSVDCAAVTCVALTFDDGPGPATGELLDALAAGGARATFFVTGSNAVARPDLLGRMSREGHLVANHTWSHRDLASLPTDRAAHQLTRAQEAIGQATGQAPTLARAPYGSADAGVAEAARGLGLALVGWDVDALDARDRDPRAVARRAVAGTRPGSIILMHDVHRSAVEAVPEILRRLSAQGYAFVTVPELFGPAGTRAGETYRSGPAGTRAGETYRSGPAGTRAGETYRSGPTAAARS